METSTRDELNSIIREIEFIIKELNSISLELATGFRNIGNERCSVSIDRVSKNYIWVKSKLLEIK